ncbi:P0560B06.25 [Oryza sativa Japonica Group]|uniref:p0560B06.25 protein n=1 Tax=Oryza sativa subsp. japonica TaxID=39947 RepID=Q93VB3_ORYSJ|nr:P0560B06.25 [Oryza sativa Japonica Group]
MARWRPREGGKAKGMDVEEDVERALSSWRLHLATPESPCVEIMGTAYPHGMIWSDLAQQEAARLRDGWVWRGGGNLGRGRWGWGRADTNTLVTDALANGVQLRVATGGGG